MTTTQSMGGETQELGVTRTTIDDLMPPQDGSIVATARSRITGGPAGTLRDDSLVSYGGMQLTLHEASKLGLVRKDAAGNYSDVQQGEQKQAVATDKDAAESAEGVPFPEVQEAVIAQLVESVPMHIQEASAHEIINGGIEALKSGGEHSEGIREVAKSFQEQGFAHFTKAGVDPIEFTNWAQANVQGEIRAAMLLHHNTRSPAVYNDLMRRFIASTAPTAKALKAGGFETRTESNGTESVFIPTLGWTSAKAAAKAGLI